VAGKLTAADLSRLQDLVKQLPKNPWTKVEQRGALGWSAVIAWQKSPVASPPEMGSVSGRPLPCSGTQGSVSGGPTARFLPVFLMPKSSNNEIEKGLYEKLIGELQIIEKNFSLLDCHQAPFLRLRR